MTEGRGTYPYKIAAAVLQQLGFRDPEQHPEFTNCMDIVSDLHVQMMKDVEFDKTRSALHRVCQYAVDMTHSRLPHESAEGKRLIKLIEASNE